VGDGLTCFLGTLQPKTKLCNFDEVRALFVHLTTKNHPYPKNRIKTQGKGKRKKTNPKL
jgi:hypothetical protein